MIEFKIPAPFPAEESDFEYTTLVRVSTHVPFGYYVDENDKDLLWPIPEELELLNQAKQHVKRYSYRDVAAWLTDASGRYISHTGLKARIKSEQKKNREGTIQRNLIKRLEEAIKKAEHIEKTKLGSVRLRDCKTTSD